MSREKQNAGAPAVLALLETDFAIDPFDPHADHP
jgi:hypothetical protein